MGMYTEIFFRANVDPEIAPFLQKWIDGEFEWKKDMEGLPEHDFFKCHRWEWLTSKSDSYFPMAYGSSLTQPFSFAPDIWVFSLHTCIKDYDGEYEKFFDWISPYVTMREGEFIGYTLYEDLEPYTPPTLYYSNGVGYRKKWGDD